MRQAILLFALCFALACAATAQSPDALPTPAGNATPPTATAAERVPVPEPSAKAVAYQRGNLWLWAFENLWGLLIPALFLFTGLSARIRNLAQRIGRRRWLVIALYFVIFLLLNFIIDLPLGYYRDFVRQHAYGLSNQSVGKWFGDELKGLLVTLIGGTLVMWGAYALLRRSPRRWWLYLGLLTIPFLLLVILISPVWIAPLFNDFGPMKDRALEAKILALADRAGIEGGRVFEVNKSADTKAVNAYVTGFANTKRIVLWDTIIAKLDENELLFVMGHEMGHYVLNHIWKRLPLLALLSIFTLWAIHRSARWLIHRYRDRFGFSELSDVASLPLILLLMTFYGFLLAPIPTALSRADEHEADRFGLEITRNNRAAATAFVKLQTENLGIPRPHPLIKLWRADHPPLGERIDFSNDYRPWETGAPRQYEQLFRQPPSSAPTR